MVSMDQVKIFVMKGAGAKAFCAGGDILEFYKSAVENPDYPAGKPGIVYSDFLREENHLNYDVFTAPKPQVCRLHTRHIGITWAGFYIDAVGGLRVGALLE